MIYFYIDIFLFVSCFVIFFLIFELCNNNNIVFTFFDKVCFPLFSDVDFMFWSCFASCCYSVTVQNLRLLSWNYINEKFYI